MIEGFNATDGSRMGGKTSAPVLPQVLIQCNSRRDISEPRLLQFLELR
jgi:hypothetical protein